jgi:hypothetical protein
MRRQMKEASQTAIVSGFWPNSNCERARKTPFANLDVLAKAWDILEDLVSDPVTKYVLTDEPYQGEHAEGESKATPTAASAVTPKRPASMRTRRARPALLNTTPAQLKEACVDSIPTVPQPAASKPKEPRGDRRPSKETVQTRVGKNPCIFSIDDNDDCSRVRESSLARSYSALSAKYCTLEDDSEPDINCSSRGRDSSIVRTYDALESPPPTRAITHGSALPPVIPRKVKKPPRPSIATPSAMEIDLGLGSDAKTLPASASKEAFLSHPVLDGPERGSQSFSLRGNQVQKPIQKSVKLPALIGSVCKTKMDTWKVDDFKNPRSFHAAQLSY